MEAVCQILHRGDFISQGHLAIFGYNFHCHTRGRRVPLHRQVEGRYAASVIQCKDSSHNFMSVKAKYCAVDVNHIALMNLKTYIFDTTAITVRI